MIVLINVGETETAAYAKWGMLARHLDITDVPAKWLRMTTPPAQWNIGRWHDEFLVLDVPHGSKSLIELISIRDILMKEGPNGRKKNWSLDISFLAAGDQTLISQEAQKSREKKPYSVRSINRKKIPFDVFAQNVAHKDTSQTLAEVLA